MNAPENTPTTCDHQHADGSTCSGHEHEPHQHDHSHPHEAEDREEKFFFSLETIALAVWGGILVWYVTTGKVTPFLSTIGIFREQALIGGLALLVLAAFNFLLRNHFPGCGHDHSEDGGHHHHHESGNWMSRLITIFILVAPVSLAAAFAPPDWTEPYKAVQANSLVATNAPTAGNAAAARLKQGDGTSQDNVQEFSLEDFKKYCPPNEVGNFPLSVSNLWSAAGDPDLRRVLKGQVAEVTAQVVNDAFSKDGSRLRVFELQMTCCAADARPVSFPIEFSGPHPDYRESGWYRVTGTVDFTEERSGQITVLKVTEMKPTTKPKENGGPAL